MLIGPRPGCTSGSPLYQEHRVKLRRTMSNFRALGPAPCAFRISRMLRPKQFLQALIAFFWLGLGMPAGAQISPGALSRAHQSLTGATNCSSCHKFGAGATLKCVECHG